MRCHVAIGVSAYDHVQPCLAYLIFPVGTGPECTHIRMGMNCATEIESLGHMRGLAVLVLHVRSGTLLLRYRCMPLTCIRIVV